MSSIIQFMLILTLFFFLHYSILTIGVVFQTPTAPIDKIAIQDHDHSHIHLVSQYSTHSAPKLQKLVSAFGLWNVIVTVAVVVITLLNIVVYKLRELQEANTGEKADTSEQLCRLFSLADILLATQNFNDALVIGRGGFGKVYKGVIDDGTITVAIKRLDIMSKQGSSEFWSEVEMLSKFRHSHLVSLIGYCKNGKEMILVYEYVVRGTLGDHLHKIGKNGDNNSLSWVQRLQICIGAARGLEYLHTGTGVKQRVIHRDVKSSNILLDDNWAAKISDFGLSKIGPANQSFSHVSTNIKGTVGYVDPHYLLTRHLTRKSDVYAFGIVLFEVLCGRPAVDLRLEEDRRALAGWAQYCIKEGTVHQIIDPNLKWEIFSSSLAEFVQIAEKCLHSLPRKRPTMSEVVVALESALALQLRTDSSMFEGESFHVGGADDDQEIENSSLEKQEVINLCNSVLDNEKNDGITTLGDGSNTNARIKPFGIITITKMVRSFLFGTTQVISERTNTSMLKEEEEIINTSGANGKQQTSADFSVAPQVVVYNADAGLKQSRAKPSKKVAFKRMARWFVLGTARMTSADNDTTPSKSNKVSAIDESSTLMNKDGGSVKELPPGEHIATPILKVLILKVFKFDQLEMATGNFNSNSLLGKGSFGKVFKGGINKKTAIAIKQFDHVGIKDRQSDVEALGKFCHPNLVNVLGYCFDKDESFLVYEYICNGNLESHLLKKDAKPLSWENRLKIALGAAEGLAYLHTTEKQVIYHQFKTCNILLDEDFNAKLSDFELLKLGLINRCSFADANAFYPPVVLIRNTYSAPEYVTDGILDMKTDVYGFGVVLLQILTGLPAQDKKRPLGKPRLQDWALIFLMSEDKLSKVIDPRLEDNYPFKGALQFAGLILKCVRSEPEYRPSMKEVLEILGQISAIKKKPNDNDRQ